MAKPRDPSALADLKANPRNPRRITPAKKAMLGKALAEYGDLGGIVWNRRTGNLVGGHERTENFRADPEAKIVLNERLAEPDSCGTIARGYVETGGTRFGYRAVDWPKKKEWAAMIAANQQGGEFAEDGLADLLGDLGANFDFDLAGFDAADLLNLGIGGPEESAEEARRSLAEQFGVPPFSVLDARQGYWQDRKRAWLALGIQSELGRGASLLKFSEQVTIGVGGKKPPGKSFQRQKKAK